MKKILFKAITLLSALTLVLFTFSCAIWTGGSDSSSITLSFGVNSKALGVGATEARVWVYANNVLVPNPAVSEGYYSTTIDPTAGGTITIKDLAPGDNYRIVVTSGAIVGTSFKPTAFGTSELFGIKAGVETSVEIMLKEISIDVPGTQPTGLVSVVVAGNLIYSASSDKIYSGTNVKSLTPPQAPWNTSTKGFINSLNITADPEPTVLVNTTKGIYFTDGNVVGTPNWGSEAPSVLQSGGIAVSGIFYQAEKEIGGYVGGNAWSRIPLDIPVAGKPILDLLVWKKDADTIFGYFATRVVGAFKVGSSDIEELTLSDILSGNENSPVVFFGETLPLIQAFGYISGNDLYLGTKNGVYKTNIEKPKTTLATLVEGTKGLNVTKIAAQGQMEAFLSTTEIVILKSNKIYKMPFLTSVVGTISDIAWHGTNLIVTGSKGICSIDTNSL